MKVVYYATQRVARANSCVRASCILSRFWLAQRRSWEVATNHKAQIKAKKIQSLCSTENCSKRVIFNKMSSVLIIFDAGSWRFLIRNLVCLSSEEKIRCAKLKKKFTIWGVFESRCWRVKEADVYWCDTKPWIYLLMSRKARRCKRNFNKHH